MRERPVYRFELRYVGKRIGPYYHTPWDQSTPATILAGARDEAGDRLVAMLGEPPSGYKWVWTIDRIDEVQMAGKGAQKMDDYCTYCVGEGMDPCLCFLIFTRGKSQCHDS